MNSKREGVAVREGLDEAITLSSTSQIFSLPRRACFVWETTGSSEELRFFGVGVDGPNDIGTGDEGASDGTSVGLDGGVAAGEATTDACKRRALASSTSTMGEGSIDDAADAGTASAAGAAIESVSAAGASSAADGGASGAADT